MNRTISDSTFYLCASAYLAPGFCEKVISTTLEEDYRSIGEAYGIDLAMVIRHCLMAQQMYFIRNLLVSVISLLIGITLINNFFMVANLEVNQDAIRVMFTLFLLAWLITFLERWLSYFYKVKAFSETRSTSNVYLKLSSSKEEKIKRAIDALNGNITIYSGFNPFVGSGLDLGGWSFALSLQKGREEMGKVLEPIHFDVSEIYSFFKESFTKLSIDNLQMEDKIYINGRDVEPRTLIQENRLSRPKTQVMQEDLQKVMNESNGKARYYKCLRMIQWDGDLVTSMFVRFFISGHSLFVETSFFLLPPIAEQFREISSLILKSDFEITKKFLMQTFWLSISLLIKSPFQILSDIQRPFLKWLNRRKLRNFIRENEFDFGANSSIREYTASKSYNRYFQKMDKEMNIKIVEKELLDCIANFLEEKNIDTSSLRERQGTILNNGVIVSGGSISAQNLSVGDKAKAVLNQVVQKTSPNTSD